MYENIYLSLARRSCIIQANLNPILRLAFVLAIDGRYLSGNAIHMSLSIGAAIAARYVTLLTFQTGRVKYHTGRACVLRLPWFVFRWIVVEEVWRVRRGKIGCLHAKSPKSKRSFKGRPTTCLFTPIKNLIKFGKFILPRFNSSNICQISVYNFYRVFLQ